MSWVTWLPKSRISTRSAASVGEVAGSGRESGIALPWPCLIPGHEPCARPAGKRIVAVSAIGFRHRDLAPQPRLRQEFRHIVAEGAGFHAPEAMPGPCSADAREALGGARTAAAAAM